MKINKKNDVTFLTFEIYEKLDRLIAVHSTRIGGVSTGCFDSMNLGFARNDDYDHVMKNYKLFSSAIGVDYDKMVLSDQWHHNKILIVDSTHEGMGIIKERSYKDYDGLITNIKGLPLVTFYADCVPIYFYDTRKEVIGMTHAGWRGTSTAIVQDMIDLMQSHYQSNIKDILIGIGPAICKKCYQVDQTVINKMTFDFISEYYDFNESENRYYIDLKNINKRLLLEKGLVENQIEVSKLCTKCRSDLFFSHRRYGNERGTQIGVMKMEV